MKIRYFILAASALIILILLNAVVFEKKKEASFISLPSLPKPIAEEYVLITSAGQNTDVYIINDIANKLMIHNFFMPQADENDLESINTLVFVVGYSDLGEKLHGSSFEAEKQRVAKLLKKAKENDVVVLTVFIGGSLQLEKNAEALLKLIAPDTDYLIGTKEANEEGFLSEIAKSNKIPMTLINGVNDLSEPFASAFR